MFQKVCTEKNIKYIIYTNTYKNINNNNKNENFIFDFWPLLTLSSS